MNQIPPCKSQKSRDISHVVFRLSTDQSTMFVPISGATKVDEWIVIDLGESVNQLLTDPALMDKALATLLAHCCARKSFIGALSNEELMSEIKKRRILDCAADACAELFTKIGAMAAMLECVVRPDRAQDAAHSILRDPAFLQKPLALGKEVQDSVGVDQ